EDFFSPRRVRFAELPPVDADVAAVAAVLRSSKHPLIVAGGGTLYDFASNALRIFAEMHGVPVAETQAGKGAIPWDHRLQQGPIGAPMRDGRAVRRKPAADGATTSRGSQASETSTCRTKATSSAPCSARRPIRPLATSSCAQPERCQPSCISCGGPRHRAAITW